ncbi:4-alpha-glucanotransferase [Falsiroseomonas sp. CW058]|uniref:4-alpha-glucanotransferase n=1 Tax=Falsiroseomonas sp. CW058 TaxID=3388664 RepID=UPI003D31EA01
MSGTTTPALDALALRMGIEPEYHDVRGELIRATAETKRLLLAAMGVPAPDEAAAVAALEAILREEWREPLAPVAVLRRDGGPPRVALRLPAGTQDVAWTIALEDGTALRGEAAFCRLEPVAAAEIDGTRVEHRLLALPDDLPFGYHRLSVGPGGAAMSLVVSPGRAWLPEGGARPWGIALQLYLLRSARNWGIGDFGDLRGVVEVAAARGAAVVGLNPLHALFPDNPEAASPYSPASRLLLNVLNIDVTAVPELPECGAALDLLGSAEFRRRLDAARAAPLVDYTAVTALKMGALRLLFDAFRQGAEPARRAAFDTFRQERGEMFGRSCLFLALRARFAAQDPALAWWGNWPEGFRDPASAELRRFAEEHAEEVEFQAWLQWVADGQLGAAAADAAARGMAVGLYRDLAVGADSGGAETWTNQKAVLSGVQVGAPRDIFNPAGQDWGLPPFHPRALRAEGYRSFIELVRANMRHAGGLRIDHVMGLMHLFCIPAGRRPAEGAYIAYPFDDLIGILTLESQRNRCLVVGEDLGTVPAGFRERMAAANILSYRILSFEQDGEGRFHPPRAYPPVALAVAGSHDLPTLRGWWEGHDIVLKRRYGLLTEEEEAWQRQARAAERERLLEALREAGVPGGGEPGMAALSRAVHGFLGRSASLLAVAQLDDMLDEPEQVNVPATDREHPNWRRKLSVALEDIAGHPGFEAAAAALRDARGEAGHG